MTQINISLKNGEVVSAKQDDSHPWPYREDYHADGVFFTFFHPSGTKTETMDKYSRKLKKTRDVVSIVWIKI